MTKKEKDELWCLIEDACHEWFNQDDEDLWEENQLGYARVVELFEQIPTEY